MQEQSNKWPPVAALAIAAALTFVALPNPLKIPNNNPGATAELAPVPGDDDVDAPSNFGQTGLATSNTLGAQDAAPPPPPPGEGREIPIDKDCVEGRQTEDPLSPPCVPYFNGNNGGDTWQGVTGEKIDVVFYTDVGLNGDPNGPYQQDADTGRGLEGYNMLKTVQAHMRYFQRRFQTYGRRVYLWEQKGSVSCDPGCRRRHALSMHFKFAPFATTYLGNEAGNYFHQAAKYGVVGFGLNEDVNTELIASAAPYVWSFYPDQEVESRWSASFICRSLLGREGVQDANKRPLPARFARDVDLQTAPRKLGFVYNADSGRGPELREMADRLKHELKRVCGYEFAAEYGIIGQGADEAGPIIADFKLKGITTIVCYCIPVPGETQVSAFQSAATGANYHPEWYWDHMSRMDKPMWQQIYGSKEHFSFGTSYYWRMPAFREQMWQVAYRQETKDGSVPNARWGFNIYYSFLNLFTGIQAAGPELTPDTVARGMFTFRFLKPSYPWLPTGSYGHEGPGPYTFIDTGMAWWWDPTGTPPGGKRGEGCQRLMTEGRRYYWDEWPIGDALIGLSGDPCTEDRQRLTDPQPQDR